MRQGRADRARFGRPREPEPPAVVAADRAGATLLGTESPELLVSEYELAKAIVSPDADRKKLEPVAADLLAKRDAFIARRINQTLGQDEFGILFVGLLHNVHRGLAPDIELVVPFGK